MRGQYLGIELGSTRIKAVVVGADGTPLAQGGYGWENRYENAVWTYDPDDVWTGLRNAFATLLDDYREKHSGAAPDIKAIGISAMMHGYFAFDTSGELLVPFRTWRNTTTLMASEILTPLFGFNIPQRWSVAHIAKAIMDDEPHVKSVKLLTTLAGYVHHALTGRNVLGVGDASGMFPINFESCEYNKNMITQFDALFADKGLSWKLDDILPEILPAGADAGVLTDEGAALLDPAGILKAGIPFCPPEGDAGTGMVATNAVRPRTGNVSAGTSVFAMVVLEHALSHVYNEIDIVTTPTGRPVAMVHCNNCTTEIDAWAGVFREFAAAVGADGVINADISEDNLFSVLYGEAMRGEPDCGGLLCYNYLAGEPVTGFDEGRPLFVRVPGSRLTFANFMRSHLYGAVATLRLGMDILSGEGVSIDKFVGHGGYFKKADAGQQVMADALKTPVQVMKTAGEGGAWGMALLAAYRMLASKGETLEDWLDTHIFAGMKGREIAPDPDGAAGFEVYLNRYRAGLTVERAAIEKIRTEARNA
jgi:sugar (pentulose or hexulose) kinase